MNSKSRVRRDKTTGVKLEDIPGGIAVGEESPLKLYPPLPDVVKGVTNSPLQIVSTKGLNEPIVSDEELDLIKKFYDDTNFNIDLKNNDGGREYTFNPNDPWIQTFTGRRFTPTNPNPDAIVIQDIAHALSMQCRFSGHIKKFYSVAQHSVLVSYLCDSADALWGLLHDSSEAYLLDLPAPLKRSGFFDNFKETENILMKAICQKFNLPEKEPPSVKAADVQMLVTEARDLMKKKRSDWIVNVNPLPFKIEPWSPDEAEDKFMHRFFELKGYDSYHYDHYLHYKYEESK